MPYRVDAAGRFRSLHVASSARAAEAPSSIGPFRRALCVLLTTVACAPLQAQSTGDVPPAPPEPPEALDPMRVLEVWARATFAETGQLQELELADEASYSAAFVAQVRRQLQSARIPAPIHEGRPARFQTGVRLRYGISAGQAGGQASLLGLAIRPLPLERSAPPLPVEILRSRGWTGRVKGTCTVDEEGRCAQVDIEALPGMPESLRRWARVTMSQWRFEPQRLDDRPVSGEFDHTFIVGVRNARPEDFRAPKFDRIEQQRR